MWSSKRCSVVSHQSLSSGQFLIRIMVVFHQDSFLSGWSYEGGLVRVVLPGWCHIMAVSQQGFLWDLHTVMDACEVLNLILKIFFSILSKLTRGDVLVLLFTLE